MNALPLLIPLVVLPVMMPLPPVRADGIPLPEPGGVSHLAVCAPEDCRTCYEFMIAEVERLSRERCWAGRWALLVACATARDTSFAVLVRDRFEPHVLLTSVTRDTLARLLPSGRLITPCVMTRSADGRILDVRPITSRTMGEAARFFDSLLTAGRRVEGP